MSNYPIPDGALDDRLGFIGTSGDYRADHAGGTGACTLPADPVEGFRPCRAFRLAVESKARGRG